MKSIREPAVAGVFYPSSESKLKIELSFLLDNYKPDKSFDNSIGIIAPHAGYIYSGKTAAYAYNAVAKKNIETIIVLSPSHREYFPGISIYDGDGYKTPLGVVEVNKHVRDKLTANSKVIFPSIRGHQAEHAVEVQIPFLQMLFKKFTIVPIVLGDQCKVYVDELAGRLADVVTDETLIVASSDLSHFFNKSKASELDAIVEKHINQFDFDSLQRDLDSGVCYACGGGAIVAMMKASDLVKKKNSVILSRSDSGDVTGDNTEVVGYLSAAVFP
jgi:MEMO1 family protein